MNTSTSPAKLVLLTLAACGLSQACLANDGDPDRSGCPADAPDCDRLEAPCIATANSSGGWPSSSPTGLTTPLKDNGDYRIWPDGRVPYVIASSVGSTTKQRVLTAMEEWQSMSGERVRFEKKLAGETAYMKFVAGGPVTSHVGYKPGTVSAVALRNPEYLTVIRHEIGHVLGLNHEQRRSDRLDHIQVKDENIVDTELCHNQFDVCSNCVDVLDYHIASVMHYRTNELSKCRVDGKPILLHLDGKPIKHEWVITPKDVLVIEELYGDPAVGTGGGGGASSGGSLAGGSSAGGSGAGGVPQDGEDPGDDDDGSSASQGTAPAAPTNDTASSCAYRPHPAEPIAWPAALLAGLVLRRARRHRQDASAAAQLGAKRGFRG